MSFCPISVFENLSWAKEYSSFVKNITNNQYWGVTFYDILDKRLNARII